MEEPASRKSRLMEKKSIERERASRMIRKSGFMENQYDFLFDEDGFYHLTVK